VILLIFTNLSLLDEIIFAEQRFTNTDRGIFKDYIANEKLELEKKKLIRKKKKKRIIKRFGIDLLEFNASNDNILIYARILNEESYINNELKRKENVNSEFTSSSDGSTVAAYELPNLRSSSPIPQPDAGLDADIAEAIRQNLEVESSSIPETHSIT
jgi:hypothetical protein